MSKNNEKKLSKSKTKYEITDDRFKESTNDPRFKPLLQTKTKVKIDSRFSGIFRDKQKFDNTQELYEQEEQDKEIDSSENQNSNNETSSISEDHSVTETSSEEEEVDFKESSSNRIALQNFDWEQLNAKDLFLLFDSLIEGLSSKQNRKLLKRVDVFMSDFGEEKMKIEKGEGPKDLLEQVNKLRAEGQTQIPSRVLREYEKNRLKYAYAIVTLEDVKISEELYESFDGLEIEFTGCHLDMRFVPEGLEIAKKPISSCDEVTEKDKKESKVLATQALAHTEVKLTWDKPIKRNTEFLFKNDDLNEEKMNDIVNFENSDEDECGENEQFDANKSHDQNIDEVEVEDNRANLNNLIEKSADDVYGDFKKSKKSNVKVTFKVGFGEKKHENKRENLKKEYNPFKNYEKTQKNENFENKQTKNQKDNDPSENFEIEKNQNEQESQIVKTKNQQREVNDIPKTKKTRKELIRSSQMKKSQKKLMNQRDNEELNLLVDGNNELTIERKKNDFKPNLDDQRFGALLSHPDFQIDRTDPRYQGENGKKETGKKRIKHN